MIIISTCILILLVGSGQAERDQTQGVQQQAHLHDDITEGVAQGRPQSVRQLHGADVTLLPYVKPHTHGCTCEPEVTHTSSHTWMCLTSSQRAGSTSVQSALLMNLHLSTQCLVAFFYI